MAGSLHHAKIQSPVNNYHVRKFPKYLHLKESELACVPNPYADHKVSLCGECDAHPDLGPFREFTPHLPEMLR